MDTNDIEATIIQNQSPGVFDVLSFVEQTAYPTEDVVVFQDVKSADLYIELVNKRNALDGSDSSTGEETETQKALTEEIHELGEKIKNSSMIFHLRGMPPGIVDDILKAPDPENDTTALERERENELVANTIIGVSNHKGDKDSRVWTGEEVAKLRRFLKEGEYGKLATGVSKVNFNAAIFDQATDAGFSGRSSDVA